MPSVPAPAAEAPRVLLVDDDSTSRILLRAMLGKLGYAVDVGENVATAQRLLENPGTEAYVAVVTDYWMPGGTGLDLLRHVHSADPTLATIIVTAEGEKSIVADVLREGANNFLDKPVQREQLHDTVARAHATTVRDRRLRASAQAARSLGTSQLHLLIQHTGVLGARLGIFYQPFTDAGGDFVTAVGLGPGRFLLLASDVSGHDLRAAYQSIYFHGLARGLVEHGADLGTVFTRFNDLLLKNWNRDDHVELSLATFGAAIDLNAGRISALNCGFPIPLLVETDGWTHPLDRETWGPLGWFEQLPPCRQYTMREPQLLLWSDGVEDLAELLGVDPLGLIATLLAPQDDPAALLARAEDDIVALAIDLRPETTTDPLARPLLRRSFRGHQAGSIDRIQEFVERTLRLALPQLADAVRTDVILCVREALLNALIHGCARSADRSAEMQIAHAPQARLLRVRVADGGPGHDFDAVAHEHAAADQLLTEHRGLVLIRRVPTRTQFSDRGATVTMEFAL